MESRLWGLLRWDLDSASTESFLPLGKTAIERHQSTLYQVSWDCRLKVIRVVYGSEAVLILYRSQIAIINDYVDRDY